jgi:glycosyltransferase involved in cell wall biosynthesis
VRRSRRAQRGGYTEWNQNTLVLGLAKVSHSIQKLSVLMPVYNEKYLVEQAVDEVLASELPPGIDREVLVVDDGSTDGTSEIVSRLAAEHSSIRLFRHEKNQGKGAAIRTAIAQATGDVCVMHDADLEYDPREHARLLQPIVSGDADVVYGSRFMPRDFKRVLFFWHSWGNRFLTLLSNFCTNLDLTDMETCSKMLRTSLLKSIPIRCDRFGVEVELTAKFAKRGFRIYETPISYRGRTYAEGKKITWWDGAKALGLILYFWIVDDVYDEKYGHAILHRLSGTHRFNRWMADVIAPWVGENVLEIGAGLGNLTEKFLPRMSYTASDIDSLHLEYLQSRYAGRKYLQVRMLDLQVPSDFDEVAGQFDTAIALNVVEHVPDDPLAFRNIFKALRPGGHACILVPQIPSLYGTLDKVLEHYRRYRPQELSAKLQDAGFEIERQFDFNRVAVLGWWLNGKILRRTTFSRFQLRIYDSLVWLLRRIDRFVPWPGLSTIVIARKPGG